MGIIIFFVVFVVFMIVVGSIEAIHKKSDQKSSGSSPDIMMGWKIPGPFDAFKDDK